MSTDPTSLPPPVPGRPLAPTPSSPTPERRRRRPSQRRTPTPTPDEPKAPELEPTGSEDESDESAGKGRRVDVRV